MTKRIQQYLFEKNFKEVELEIKRIDITTLPKQSQLMIDYTMIKIALEKTLDKNQEDTNQHEKTFKERIKQISRKYQGKVDRDILDIYSLAMEGFLLEIGNQHTCSEEISIRSSHSLSNSKIHKNSTSQKFQKQFLNSLSKLPSLVLLFPNKIKQVSDNKILKLCDENLYFSMSLLELYTKRSMSLRKKELFQEIQILSWLISKYAQRYPKANKLSLKLYTILMHLFVHCSMTAYTDHTELINRYIGQCCEQLEGKNKLITTETVVVFLYNCLKIMLAFNRIPQKVILSLERLYQVYKIKISGKNYSTHIIKLFFIVKIEIFKMDKPEVSADNKQANSDSNVLDYRISQLNQKFSDFFNVNMDQTLVQLNQITHNIIRHKVASLSTIIGVKLGIKRFSKDFLQIMYDSPFNNDIQTIKLCFQLFEFNQFQKLEYLLQIILAIPANNNTNSNQRQVLIALSSIFNGLYLENREQALLYCKLNHQNYLSRNKGQSSITQKQLLKQETLLQYVGFGYYNLAKHQEYLENRTVYMIKALENFLRSYQINPQNYLLNYCISKIYLQMFDYDHAYKHAMQSCKSYRGSWAPFCLLACIYMCQRKIHKSLILIDELLKKHSQIAILHYIRAYLEVNKLLLEVENDEEIEAAKMLGEQFYLNHFERILKSKSFHNVIKSCQSYYQLSLGRPVTEDDENFFSPQNIGGQIDESGKYLLKIVRLFIQMGQLNLAQGILKLMTSNYPPAMFCRGLLYERRKQFKQAKAEYNQILNLSPCYHQALIKLAYLEEINDNSILIQHRESRNSMQQSHKQAYSNASMYLEIAGKFVNNSEYILAKALLLSKKGRLKEGNELLLKECDLAWCQDLPDLLYYY